MKETKLTRGGEGRGGGGGEGEADGPVGSCQREVWSVLLQLVSFWLNLFLWPITEENLSDSLRNRWHIYNDVHQVNNVVCCSLIRATFDIYRFKQFHYIKNWLYRSSLFIPLYCSLLCLSVYQSLCLSVCLSVYQWDSKGTVQYCHEPLCGWLSSIISRIRHYSLVA